MIPASDEHDTLPNTEGNPYVALWRAVILQAFLDMASNSLNKTTNGQKHTAIHWLLHPSRDLHTVCDFAGIHPDEVIARARRVMAENGLHWRLPPGKSAQLQFIKRSEKRKEYRLRKNMLMTGVMNGS